MSAATIPLGRFAVVCFLATGVPFALVMALVSARPLKGVLIGVAGGAAMTVVIGGLHLAATRRGVRVVDVLQTDGFSIAGDLSGAEAAAERALSDLRIAEVRREERDERVVLTGRAPMTWKSWGEVVTVELGPRIGDATSVHVSSRPWLRTTLADYGKNLANVRAIRASIEACPAARVA